MVAVDITGHDIIGLGFDICGNQHDGVFIKSVFSRGPARESGCIETGDRIKCLNISFDNITLQDACDILNCGSPYKLRLLLEKRAAPPKLTNKLIRSPAPRALYYGPKSALQPDNSSSGINLSRNQHLGGSSGGALCATKSYLRRLVDLVAPTSHRAQMNHAREHLDLRRSQHEFGTSLALSGPRDMNCDELIVNGQVPYLGSVAARRHLFSGGVSLALDSLNQANDSDTQTTITQRASDPDTYEEARINSRAPITSSMNAQKRCLSHSDSIGSNLRGRFSVDSEAEMLNVGSSTNDFNTTDSSLDYQNRNANHRLHGPKFETRAGQMMQVEDFTDLRMVASQNQLNSHDKSAVARRQSVACVMQKSSSGSIKANSKNLTSSNHLEQTQSQPEIALREREIRLSEEGGAVDERVEILSSSKSNNHSTTPDTRNWRFQMASSVSTPSVNLLGSNNQQQSKPASTLNNDNSSSAADDWRKAPSSLRRKKQLQQQDLKESIREEAGGGSDSSYADSTSKLVERRQEQSNTGASSNNSRTTSTSATNVYQRDVDNSRPKVTQITRDIESRNESLSSSSAATTNNSRDTLTSLINRNKTSQTEQDYRD